MLKRLAVATLLVLGGCMPFKFFALPIPAAEAKATFAPLAAAASNLAYRYYVHEDRVIVEPDESTRIDYMFDVSGNYSMCVMLKNAKGLSHADREMAFTRGKKKGDEIFALAIKLRLGATAPTVQSAPGGLPPPAAGVQVEIR